LQTGIRPEGGQRVRVLALMDRIADLQQDVLAIPGDDASIHTPKEQFRAEAGEAANLLRMARERLRRAIGGREALR